jgi:hypothetical protein
MGDGAWYLYKLEGVTDMNVLLITAGMRELHEGTTKERGETMNL